MIKNIAKFFCMVPLLVGVLGATAISGNTGYAPPNQDLREETQDCIKEIRKKQNKIKKEIEKIKELIKDNRQNRPQKETP